MTTRGKPKKGRASKQNRTWFELHFPHELGSEEVVVVLQPLAYRPKVGWRQRTPTVVFELRAEKGRCRWFLGVDGRLAGELPNQLRAQLPSLQLVPRPRHHRVHTQVASDVQPVGLSQPLRTDKAANVTAGLLEVMGALQASETAVVQWIIGPAQSRRSPPVPFNLARALGLVAVTKETPEQRRNWRAKAAEPLFAVRARIGASAASVAQARAIVGMLGEALQLANASYAELRMSRPTVRTARQLDLITPAGMRWSGILNAAELATVLGWPVDGVASLRTAHGRQHPAPPKFLLPTKSPPSRERILGTSLYPADEQRLVIMPTRTALHHTHVIGPTGSGKSTMLANLARADMTAGHGVLVIEPRGDLVADVLAGVPDERREDVVLIEPGVTDQVVGINPLAGAPADAERRADELLHLMHELYGTSVGPRSSDVLLHALIALARSPGGTFADLPVLLTNATFRRKLLAEVSDPLVLAPFFGWFDGLSDAERHQVIAPILNKTRAFLSRTAIRRLLGQAEPRFHLDDLFTGQRIVVVNLNKGIIGSETAQLIGAFFLTQLWHTMQRRAKLPVPQRHPVMVLIDEVQDYLKLPVDLGDLFAQARGLGVSLTVAHQHLAQLSPKLQAALTANARSRIAFRPSKDDAKPLADMLGGNLTASDLARLGGFEAYVRLLVEQTASEPFIVRTRQLAEPLINPAQLRAVSQQHYGVDGPELDRQLAQRWRGHDVHPDAPIGDLPRSAA